ncbi:hypothetical protein Ahy_A06g030503 isoform A [Arachis hypogaea]|uniref:BZIP domain-containing protein n=1 Tax=Arachis hypogaea TaxID=3818 RepID=A0A445CWG4_ARAHY|nr:hypothetical protein Ahy_A06g030503 isoform A [Arachis hypogaea]
MRHVMIDQVTCGLKRGERHVPPRDGGLAVASPGGGAIRRQASSNVLILQASFLNSGEPESSLSLPNFEEFNVNFLPPFALLASIFATATSEYTSNSASNKKCRRRKTFSQLQEEESSLLREKIYLTKEIANVSASCKAQRARNESLKRIKLDLGSAPDGLPHPNSDQPKWTAITSIAAQGDTIAAQGDTDTLPQPQTAESARSVFLVPDLNMMPSEDDSYMDIQRGMS